ncbi:hypothetical protein ACIQMV_08695 [Streptomyces sp. NPDC091412]|uniref:hypothetical protein n=1 Tax=Streptomyces sp. NPDC091412 TaxID=3366002 RepID=UPI0038028F83
MEILLIAACAWLVHTAGAQSEQAKLGLSPAQRAVMRERTRHEKAVQKIADRYGVDTPDSEAPAVPRQEAATATETAVPLPAAFRSGYRSHTRIERIATPLGRRAGGWAAQGVAWAQDTGRGAVREYRKRRTAAGGQDPAPVLVPLPPRHAPTVPRIPDQPPTAAADQPAGVTLTKPTPDAEPEQQPEQAAGPDQPAGQDPKPAQDTAEQQPTTKQGVGRMAAEVTYESVMDESDELSLMCDDDSHVYDRIRERCEREIGRADELIAALDNAGAGQGVIGRVATCKEQYQLLLGQIDDLKTNTIAQGEAVVKAKALLEAGQGVYAGIAQDMQSVADRDFYLGDAVDGEDTAADTETYETKAA